MESNQSEITSAALDCPYTIYLNPVPIWGPTFTSFSSTTTETAFYNCHGCDQIDAIYGGHIFEDKVVRTVPT